jgi:hypothetical protein
MQENFLSKVEHFAVSQICVAFKLLFNVLRDVSKILCCRHFLVFGSAAHLAEAFRDDFSDSEPFAAR